MADLKFSQLPPFTEMDPVGRPNGASPAQARLVVLTGLACEQLQRQKVELTGNHVHAAAATLAMIVSNVQARLFDGDADCAQRSMAAGVSGLLVNAMRTALQSLPMPFGRPVAEVNEWVSHMSTRVYAIVMVAMSLRDLPPDATPWAELPQMQPSPGEAHAQY